MLARTVGEIPEPAACAGGCRYEPKWDGFRCIAAVDGDGGVTLTSRRDRPMDTAFPDVRSAVGDYVPVRTVVDGEIVRWSAGRLDFEALQRRNRAGRARARELATAEPCHYVLFDVLEDDGKDVSGRPLADRRARLEEIFTGIMQPSPITLSPQTDDVTEAREWFADLAVVGIEGLVVKAASGRYRPGTRGWLRVKRHDTTEAIIGGVTGTLTAPQDLILGRYASASGELRVAGRTTALGAAAAAELAPLLHPAGDEHPWPDRLAVGWHTTGEYVRVRPDVVVEVRVDVARDADRWRHPLRFMRVRTDLSPGDVPTDLDLET